MPPRDEDSSDSDIGDYSTTNVLLGYASKEPTDDSFSQLGGHPVSLQNLLRIKALIKITMTSGMARSECSPFGIARKVQILQKYDEPTSTAERRLTGSFPWS